MNTLLSWQQSLQQTYQDLTKDIIALLPRLLEASSLLLVGLLVAHALRILTKKLIYWVDSLFQRSAKTSGTKQQKIKHSYAIALSRLVFWVTILFFIASAFHILGWKLFSGWMKTVMFYLPSLFACLMIVLIGVLLGNGTRMAIIRAASAAGIMQSELLARIAQLLVVVAIVTIGVEQIGINVHFLADGLIVIIGVLFAGLSLAFGLGAKNFISNIIGAQSARAQCPIGHRMTIGSIEGIVIEITQDSIVLETANGRALIPANHFHTEHIHLSATSSE